MNSKTFSLTAILAFVPVPALATGSLELEQQQFLEEPSQPVVSQTLEAEQQQFLAEPTPKLKPEAIAYRPQRQPVYRSYIPQYTEPRPAIPIEQPIIQYRPRRIRYAPPPKLQPDLKKPEGYSRVEKIPGVEFQQLRSPQPEPILQGIEEFIYPLAKLVDITSPFGWRSHPITGAWKFHSGTDFGAEQGTSVLSVFSGAVISADWRGGYGKAIVIQHSENVRTLFGHLSEIFVQPGQYLNQGTVIGQVGSTGNSTGPHLHFELQKLNGRDWVAIDSGREVAIAAKRLRVFLASRGAR